MSGFFGWGFGLGGLFLVSGGFLFLFLVLFFWFWFGFARVGGGAGMVIFVFKNTKFYKFYFAKHMHTYSKQ